MNKVQKILVILAVAAILGGCATRQVGVDYSPTAQGARLVKRDMGLDLCPTNTTAAKKKVEVGSHTTVEVRDGTRYGASQDYTARLGGRMTAICK